MTRRHPLSIGGGGDRNARALREHQHTQFVERVRTGLAQPLDRFSDPIGVGDMVLLTPDLLPLAGKVHAIEALPLPQQSPEASAFIRVMITCSVPTGGHADYPIVQLVVKKKRAEWNPEPSAEGPTSAPEPPPDTPLAVPSEPADDSPNHS